MARPTINNTQSMEEIVRTPQTRTAFINELRRLARAKTIAEASNKQVGEDLKAASKAFGISSGYFNQIIKKFNKGELEVALSEGTALVDVLAMVLENTQSDSE